VVVAADVRALERFEGDTVPVTLDGQRRTATVGPLTARNAAALRAMVPWLVPTPIGLVRSAGCGDRLGLATPGHIRAFRRSTLAPVLAQQSVRENARTGRTPQDVVDAAMWGVFQEGWREGFGADADHLKTTDDIDRAAPAGCTLYTIDPGAHVDDEASRGAAAVLREKCAALPWSALESSWDDTRARFGRPIDLGPSALTATDDDWLRAAVKYGRVIAHTVAMCRHLRQVALTPFELEVSIDETETVTTLAEHVYIATELRRLGVSWVSLAPRYVGEFYKGIDYVGDLQEFERSFRAHLSVARTFGPYKLSLHSGSDKFRIFPVAAALAGELVHLKTSGTSYVEALRAVAQVDPDLFRTIAALARQRYTADRAGYHVSADLERMPDVAGLSDEALSDLLDDPDARQIVHVGFGSLCQRADLRQRLLDTLRANEETYYAVLEKHFAKHFAPFDAV
jgi:hypothetical protein